MNDREAVIQIIHQAFDENEYSGDNFLLGSFEGSEPFDDVQAFKGLERSKQSMRSWIRTGWSGWNTRPYLKTLSNISKKSRSIWGRSARRRTMKIDERN